MCEQTHTCGNCKSSEKARKVDENNEDERKQVTCKKSFPIAGLFHDIDKDASDCEGWEPKDEQKQ